MSPDDIASIAGAYGVTDSEAVGGFEKAIAYLKSCAEVVANREDDRLLMISY